MPIRTPDNFQCIQCGECCRHINLIPPLAQYDRGDGVCIYLKDNLCTIYAERPEICRVDMMYEKYFSHVYSRETFYQLNMEVCKTLQKRKDV